VYVCMHVCVCVRVCVYVCYRITNLIVVYCIVHVLYSLIGLLGDFVINCISARLRSTAFVNFFSILKTLEDFVCSIFFTFISENVFVCNRYTLASKVQLGTTHTLDSSAEIYSGWKPRKFTQTVVNKKWRQKYK